MTHTYSLVSILKDDPDFAKRFQKAVDETKQAKKTLIDNATEYNKQHKAEILEGTRKRQLLISEGEAKGLREEEINWGGQFLPTVRTPILNFLYFLLHDFPNEFDERTKDLRSTLEEQVRGMKHDEELLEHVNPDLLYLLMSAPGLSNTDNARKSQNEKYGSLQDDYEVNKSQTKVPDDMDSMMFEQMGHELFKKVKKLKALSYSTNQHEAALAHLKFLKLCKEYHLNPDQVPCAVKEDFE